MSLTLGHLPSDRPLDEMVPLSPVTVRCWTVPCSTGWACDRPGADGCRGGREAARARPRRRRSGGSAKAAPSASDWLSHRLRSLSSGIGANVAVPLTDRRRHTMDMLSGEQITAAALTDWRKRPGPMRNRPGDTLTSQTLAVRGRIRETGWAQPIEGSPGGASPPARRHRRQASVRRSGRRPRSRVGCRGRAAGLRAAGCPRCTTSGRLRCLGPSPVLPGRRTCRLRRSGRSRRARWGRWSCSRRTRSAFE